jgi:phage shock protein A
VARSILGRVSTLLRANVNAMLDSAEDPEKMLDQMVRDFTENIADAEQAVAQTVGNLRLVEDDLQEAQQASREWGSKAAAAVQKGQDLNAAGKVQEADKFEELAKIALRRQITFEEQARTYQSQVTQQTDVVEKLKDGLNQMRLKREELVQKRDELVSRAKMASAQVQVQKSIKSISVVDPTSDLNRFEERIRRQEALARGMEEVSASSIDQQFEMLDTAEDDLEVEARLAALKAGPTTPQLPSGA